MRQDLRPYWVKKSYLNFRHWYAEYFLRPECLSLGPHHNIMKPWYVHISGANITIGRCFTAIAEPGQRVEIGVWGRKDGEGRVRIGDCANVATSFPGFLEVARAAGLAVQRFT